MTITASVPRNDYVGNGATVFPYTFKIFTSSEIEVQLDGVVQTLGFTVSGVGSASGNVTFSVAPANGVKILLLGKTTRSQSTDWVENDPLTAQTIEDAVDRLTRDIQELDEALGRTLGFKKSSLQSSKVLDDLVANKYLQVKSDASGIQMVDVVQLLGSISSISGLDTNRIPYGVNTTSLTTSANFLFNGTGLQVLSGQSLFRAGVAPIVWGGVGTSLGELTYTGSNPGINVLSGADFIFFNTGTERMRLTNIGILAIGTSVTSSALGGDLVISGGYRRLNAAGTDTIVLIDRDASNSTVIGGGGNDIKWSKALVALGGGAAPTFGTIGGSGPATAAQNAWMRVIDSSGAAFWVPAWK